MLAYVGAFTAGNIPGEHGKGLMVLDADLASGAITHLQTLGGVDSPSFLAVHPRLPVLYAGERQTDVFGPGESLSGSMTSFNIGPDGRLSVLHRQPSGGAEHISLHPSGRYLIAAISRSYSTMAFPLDADGRVCPASGVVQHWGRGVHASCWEAPFPHFATSDWAGKRIFTCDMGLDRIMMFDFDDQTGRLAPSPHPFAQVSSGAGPRHLALHPTQPFVYVLNQVNSTMSVFGYDAETAAMRIIQTCSTVPAGFQDRTSGAAIAVHPSGKFVYCSNRGHDSIAAFAIDQQSGWARPLECKPSLGEGPWHLAIDPTGRLLLVANQRSGDIVSFWIGEAGQLSATGYSIKSPSASCIVFRAAT